MAKSKTGEAYLDRVLKSISRMTWTAPIFPCLLMVIAAVLNRIFVSNPQKVILYSYQSIRSCSSRWFTVRAAPRHILFIHPRYWQVLRPRVDAFDQLSKEVENEDEIPRTWACQSIWTSVGNRSTRCCKLQHVYRYVLHRASQLENLSGRPSILKHDI